VVSPRLTSFINDLGEAYFRGDTRQFLFMLRVTVAMHKDDGQGTQSTRMG
jgi:hypothetical protein